MRPLKSIWTIKITNENSFSKGSLKATGKSSHGKSSDGLKIEGVLSRPVEFDSNKNILY